MPFSQCVRSLRSFISVFFIGVFGYGIIYDNFHSGLVFLVVYCHSLNINEIDEMK